ASIGAAEHAGQLLPRGKDWANLVQAPRRLDCAAQSGGAPGSSANNEDKAIHFGKVSRRFMTPSLWNHIRSPYFSGAIAALIIMTFSFVNGYALFFNDSRSYVHGPMLAFDLLTKADLSRDWPDRQPTADGGTAGTT